MQNVRNLRLALLAIALTVWAGCADREPTAPVLEPAAPETDVLATSERSVVVFHDSTSVPDAGLALIELLGGTVTSNFDGIGVVFVSGLDAADLEALRDSDLVEGAGPDYLLDWLPEIIYGDVIEGDPDDQPSSHDPAGASQFKIWQWGPQRVAADQAWAAGHVSDASIRVAILDTGIDFLHRELEGLVDLESSASFVEGEPDVDDHHFHGTHVASSVATNSVSIAGIAPHSTLIAVKVLSFQGSGTFEGVIGGIMHAADVDAHVINMSLGAEFDRRVEGGKELIEATRRGVKYAEKAGTIVISAAGNSAIDLDDAGAPIVALPCMVSTVCVAATGPLNGQFDDDGPILTENHDQPAFYTNYGLSAIDVAAPGGNANPDDPDRSQGTWRVEDLVVGALAARCLTPGLAGICTVNNQPLVNFYVFAAGTSMATPHVSGAAAMIQAAHGGALSVDDVYDILTETADDVGEPGPDPFSNHGRINVFRAVTR